MLKHSSEDMYLHWGVEQVYKTKPDVANVTEEQNLELYWGLIDAQRAGKVRHIGVPFSASGDSQEFCLA